MKYCIIFVIILFSCSEEVIKVPIGCECNKGRKLDFSKAIFDKYPTDFMVEQNIGLNGRNTKEMVPNHYTEVHCNATTLYVCGSTIFILEQGGVKRFIYNPLELN